MRTLLLAIGVIGASGAGVAYINTIPKEYPIPMVFEEDGKVYIVNYGQTLLESYILATTQEEGHPGSKKGRCYHDDTPEDKVEDDQVVACSCYKDKGCGPNPREAASCKRYCSPNKCDCCKWP